MNLRDRAALTAGRAAGWASRVTGHGAGTQVSGRVMLAIAPDLLADVADGRRVAIVSATNGKTTTTRLLAEALRACGVDVVSNHTGANMPAGVAAALGRDREARTAVLEVDERWVPKVVDPLRAEVLVLGNLTARSARPVRRGAQHRRAVAGGVRRAPRTRGGRERVRSARGLVGRAGPQRHVGRPRRAVAVRRRDLPECAALLTWTDDAFACGTCGFAQPEAAYRLAGDTLETPAGPIALDLALPGDWNRMNAALALTTAIAHFGVAASPPSPGSGPSRWCRAGSPRSRSPTGARRACCSRRTRRAGPRCCAGCNRTTRRWCSR